MCEVGKCCLCISLYNGCLISAVVTIAVSICQTTIFSLILFIAYNSSSYTTGDEDEDTSPSSLNDTFTFENETGFGDGAAYSFSSKQCPFGFVPLYVSNKMQLKQLKEQQEEAKKLSEEDEGFTPTLKTPFANLSLANVTKVTKCVAPGRAMLYCMVVFSFLYGIVGIILFIGVRKGVSQMLSVWFFYTVGYNILALVVGLLDGVYTGAADISSYVVCAVTVYCIVVVDSYYEKVLISTEECPGGNSAQNSFSQQPSLVVVKSSPQSELDPNTAALKLLHHNGHSSGVMDDGGGDGGITEPFLGRSDSARDIRD